MDKIHKFTLTDLLVKPDSDYQTYQPRDKSITKAVSWPARKRLLSHIQFLTLYLKPTHKICVYSGVDFQPLLSVLFPTLIFHVYDPTAQLTLTERIQITPSVLTPEVAAQYQDQSVLLISQPNIPAYAKYWSKKIAGETKFRLSQSISVRLGIIIDNNGNPTGTSRTKQDFSEQLRSELHQVKQQANLAHEVTVWDIVQSQQGIVKSVNPDQAWLAFRLPYPVVEEFKQVAFLTGVVHRLAWSGFESTETALLPVRVNGEYSLSMWDSTAYEGAMFFHNARTREQGIYVNQFTDKLEAVSSELLSDFDSSLEVFLLTTYRDRFTTVNEDKFVVSLSELITAELNRGNQKAKSLTLIRNKSKLNKNDPFVKPTVSIVTSDVITPALPLPDIGLNGVELPSLVIPQPEQIINGIPGLIPVASVNGESIGVDPDTLQIQEIPGPNGVVIPVNREINQEEETRISPAKRNPFVRPNQPPSVAPIEVSGRNEIRPTNPFVAPRIVRPTNRIIQPAVAQPVTPILTQSTQIIQPAVTQPVVPIVRPISGGTLRSIRPINPPPANPTPIIRR